MRWMRVLEQSWKIICNGATSASWFAIQPRRPLRYIGIRFCTSCRTICEPDCVEPSCKNAQKRKRPASRNPENSYLKFFPPVEGLVLTHDVFLIQFSSVFQSAPAASG